jgi:syntaxin 18
MDRTEDFKKMIEWSIGLEASFSTKGSPTMLSNRTISSPFFKEARDIYTSLALFKQYLQVHRKMYLNYRSNEEDKDHVDQYSMDYQTACIKKLDLLKTYLEKMQSHHSHSKTVLSNDDYICQCEIVILLNQQLHKVFKQYTDMKAIRLRYQWEKQQWWLKQKYNVSEKISMIPASPKQSEEVDSSPMIPHHSTSISVSLLEKENQKILEEMNYMMNEIKATEKAIMDIVQLQSIFQSHVVQQAQEIEQLYDEAIGTTERVKDGNKYLAQAQKHSASFRKILLFFLMLCTFALLFLDWYG